MGVCAMNSFEQSCVFLDPALRVSGGEGALWQARSPASRLAVGDSFPLFLEGAGKNPGARAVSALVSESLGDLRRNPRPCSFEVADYQVLFAEPDGNEPAKPARWAILNGPLFASDGGLSGFFHRAVCLEARASAPRIPAAAPEERVAELERRLAESQQLLRGILAANEDQRRRIAKELHDHFGQHLAALMLGLQSLEGAPPARAGSTLSVLRRVADALGAEAQRLTKELRPAALDDIGLNSALVNYVEDWTRKHSIAVDLQTAGLEPERLPGYLETAVYRIVQEAMTNIVKHSQASRVSVVAARNGGAVSLAVEDNGCGFDPELADASATPKFGLRGMKERARLAGGVLEVESSLSGGTAVIARLPCVTEEKNHD